MPLADGHNIESPIALRVATDIGNSLVRLPTEGAAWNNVSPTAPTDIGRSRRSLWCRVHRLSSRYFHTYSSRAPPHPALSVQ